MFDLGHAVVTFTDDGRADLKVHFNRSGGPDLHASGTWWAMNSDNGNFSITFSLVLDEKSRKFETDPKTHLVFELPSSTTFTLLGTCKGHDLTLGDVVASYDVLWPTHATATGLDSNFCEVFCTSGAKGKLS